jgi:NAD(P)H-dependent FMN reductase
LIFDFPGNFGGIRAAVALRPFLQELGMIMLPSGVTIPTVQKSGISDDGSMDNERIDQHMTKVANELNWYIEALQAKKSETNGFPN